MISDLPPESRWNANQRAVAKIVEEEMRAAGINADVIAAALVNAWEESRLNPKAIGDGGNSVGLFQLNIHGAGSGMSVAERQDPRLNTKRIIETYRKQQGLVDAGIGDIPEATRLWTVYVERPKDSAKVGVYRGSVAKTLFPKTTAGGLFSTILPSQNERKPSFHWGWAVTIPIATLLALAGVGRLRRHLSSPSEFA